jgi:hypothetical protein
MMQEVRSYSESEEEIAAYIASAMKAPVNKRFFFFSKMWHSFSKCVKVSVSVLKVSVNVLYFQ